MNYSELLSQYIEQSGLTIADLAKKMNERGVKIERSYISMLKNNKTKNPASEEINIALAEVTGGDKDKLLMAAFLDKAPEKLKNTFNNIESINSYLNHFLMNSNLVLDYKTILENIMVSESISKEEAEKMCNISPTEFVEMMSFEEKLEILKVFVEDSLNQKKSFDQYIREINEVNPELKTNIIPFDSGSMLRVPVVGKIAAGSPIDRIENIENYTLIDPYILRGKDGFALEVQGDSMTGDRVFSGDLVIVAKQDEVTPNEIAVVAVNDECVTLKRVRREGNMCLLIPSNPTMQPSLVPAETVKIIGKVVEVKFWPK
ncbi:S24 family peptidase [Paenibacillus sp. NRS-1782]|uniref:LexA family protein n=1 Tax=unclassified Paenibacillus TaxID=185978 RepID=UPI003D2D16D9